MLTLQRQAFRHRIVALVLSLLLTGTAEVVAETFYIATDGNDENRGTLARPFGTFDHAIGLAKAGDTIYVRGGTYTLDHSIEIDKAGASGTPIKLWSYGNESPILDFSKNPRHATPPQPRENDTLAAAIRRPTSRTSTCSSSSQPPPLRGGQTEACQTLGFTWTQKAS